MTHQRAYTKKNLIPLLAGDQRPLPPTSRTRLLSRVRLFDIAWAGSAPFLAFLVRDGAINRLDITVNYCAIALVLSLIAFQWFKISTPIPGFFSVHDASKIAQACLITVALTSATLFTFTRLQDAPRSVPVIHLLLLLGGLLSERALYRLLIRPDASAVAAEWHSQAENIIIVEASRLAWFFSKMVEEFASRETRILAILDSRPALQSRSLNGYPIVGPPAHLAKIVDEYSTHGIKVDKVVMATHPGALLPSAWEQIQKACEDKKIEIEWLYERFVAVPHKSPPISAEFVDGVGAESVVGAGLYWKVKRLLDLATSLLMAVAIAPLALAVAIVVCIDVGTPIVFWQQRIGYLGRPLRLYKFRTMRSAFDQEGGAVPESDRISSIGLVLRRNRLDEIPQLLNILKGDMSLIGPRPLLPIDQPPGSRLRLRAKPGLTGLAQVNGGKLLSPDEKDALDEWYLNHASLWLDIKILARTLIVIMCGDTRRDDEVSAAMAGRKSRVTQSSRTADTSPLQNICSQ